MRITWPASIPGLLGKTPVAGSPLVLDSEGVVQLGIPSSGGGGIPEAPIDGELYGRQDGAWKLVSDDFLTQATADLTYLQLAGGTMSGDIQMAGNTVTGLPDPVSPSDAVNLDYLVGRLIGKENVPSGVVSGGELSFTAPSTITVAPGTGTIVDSYTNPLSPNVQLVSWVQQSVDVGLVTSRPRTSVYIDNTGTLQFIADPNPPGTNIWRENIYLGYAFHDYADTGQIIGINEIRALPGQTADSLIDFMRATALFPILLESTGGFSPNADLTFNIADQVWWAPGVSESTTPEDPNFKYVTAQSPAQFFYINSLGSILTGSTVPTTLITPGLYEPTPNTPTTIPGNAQRSTIQRVYVTLAGNTAVMLGQQYWNNLDDALLYINQDIAEHVVPQQLRYARLVAYIILEKGSTDLQDGTDVIIVNEEGIPIGGGSVPVHGHDGTYVRLDGSNGPMQGSLNFGNYNIINLADPTNPQDAATKFYVDAADSLLDDRLNDLEVLAPYLRLVGGTMLGDIDMGGINVVVNMGDPTNPQDATTKFYVDQADAALDARLDALELNGPYLPLAGGTMSGAIDMDSNRITNLPAPVDPDDAARLSSLDAYLPLAGGTITGGLVVQQGLLVNSGISMGGTTGQAGVISNVLRVQGRANETFVLQWLLGGNFEVRDPNANPILSLTGSLMTSAVQLNMSNQKIVSLATPTDPADAATKQYVDDNSGGGGGVPSGGIRGDEIVKLSGTDGDADWRERVAFGTSSPPAPIVGDLWLDESADGTAFLPLSGGTMSGDINMGGNAIRTGNWLGNFGSAGSPPIATAVQPSTGMYFELGNRISFSTDGQFRLGIDSTDFGVIPAGSNAVVLRFGVANTGTTSATAAIESSWGTGSLPQIGIGVTRDALKASTIWRYDGRINHLTATEQKFITGDAIVTMTATNSGTMVKINGPNSATLGFFRDAVQAKFRFAIGAGNQFLLQKSLDNGVNWTTVETWT